MHPPSQIQKLKIQTKLLQKSMLTNQSSIYSGGSSIYPSPEFKHYSPHQNLMLLQQQQKSSNELVHLKGALHEHDLTEEDYLAMLSQSVLKRQKELECSDPDLHQSDKSSDSLQQIANEHGLAKKTIQLNLESLVLCENKLHRIAQIVKKLKPLPEFATQAQFDHFNNLFGELIDLCEDFWAVLRTEVKFLTQVPHLVYEDDSSHQGQLTRSFCLQMIVVSLLGFMVSNQDFTRLADFTYLTHFAHKSFLVFMQTLMCRFTPEMLETSQWARNFKQIVSQKTTKLLQSSSGGFPDDHEHHLAQQLGLMVGKMQTSLQKLIATSAKEYDGVKLFDQCASYCGSKQAIPLKRAITLVGQGLRDDFSEIQSEDSQDDDGQQSHCSTDVS